MSDDSPFSEVPDIMLEEADEGDYEPGVDVDEEDIDDVLLKLFGKRKKRVVCN